MRISFPLLPGKTLSVPRRSWPAPQSVCPDATSPAGSAAAAGKRLPAVTRTLSLLSGKPTLRENLSGLAFEVSPRSFLQVNPVQTQKLYRAALDLLSPQSNETVADVYCGIGTISLLMAQRAGKVIGIEVVPEAVKNARENAARNGIHNALFLCAPAEDALPKLVADGQTIDCLTVDPPRKGCDTEVIDAILASGVERMVYISCNPATLARDIKLLTAGGFTVETVQPVDMFPRCGHVETVTLITRA